MKYHCGLLSEQPDKDRRIQWIRKGWWHEGLPEDIDRELRIWLAMPGIPAVFTARALGVNAKLVNQHIGGFEKYRDEVIENWLSITREDCVRLAPITGTGFMPVFIQMQLIEDLKTMPPYKLAKEYGVSQSRTRELRRKGPVYRLPLPEGFKILMGHKLVGL